MDEPETAKISSVATTRQGTVVGAAARELWRTLRDDCRAIPARVWWRWGMTLAIGFAACAAFSHIGTRVMRAWVHRGLHTWDERWLTIIEQHGPVSFPNAILLESPGNLSYLIPLTVTASIIAIRRHRPLAAINIQVAYWLQRPLVLIGWQTWDRARPRMIGEGIAAPGLHSFPSGHAALCVAVYGFLAYLWIRSSGSAAERALAVVLVGVLTAIVSVARVRLGSHWPSDMVAGVAIGVAWLAVVIVAHRRASGSLP